MEKTVCVLPFPMTQWCVTFRIVKHMGLRQKCDYISADALSLISQYTWILHSSVLFTEIKGDNKLIDLHNSINLLLKAVRAR